MKRAFYTLLLAALLSACGGTPPPADWKMNAVSMLEHAQQRWLEGDSKAADLALSNARNEIAKSARTDLLARAELAICAVHIASLDFTACSAFDKMAPDASASDKTYARFLAADWTNLDAKALPAHYADLIGAKDDSNANKAAAAIKDPLPRLIAAALLFRSGRIEPALISASVDTASERGWRRPLLAWLEVQKKRAQTSGDLGTAAALQRRIDLVLESTKQP
jgi:hypothetical protein